MRKIINFSVKSVVIFFTLFAGQALSQSYSGNSEQLESISIYRHSLTKEIRLQTGASKEDFNTFTRFYEQHFDSIRGNIFADFKAGKLTTSNMVDYFKPLKNSTIELYKRFAEIVKEYPSTVSEFRHRNTHKPLTPCDSSGCGNIDFSNGTLSGWYAYYSSNTSVSTSSFGTYGAITGGACGAVTKSAGPDAATGGSYQVTIMSGAGSDPIVPIPVVSPYGSKYSARVGDSTNPNTGVAILEKTFFVTSANDGFTYQYAAVLESGGHPYNLQPYFTATLFDQNGDTIGGCSRFISAAGKTAKEQGFDSIPDPFSSFYLYYKPWSFVFVSLRKYIGQCVTMQFVTGDCAYTAHFGYAYVDASCSPLTITASSPAICGSKVTLTAPIGGFGYSWTGPTGGIIGSDSTRTITVDSAGKYTVIIIPFNGKACADTLSITLPKAAGPPPIPSFTADTVCVGTATQFVNTSNPGPGPGVKYYWDFYNLGIVNDSSANPMWTYSKAGVYTVKLSEINNGCGADTLIKVRVDSASTPGFTYSSTCVGQAVNFTNTSTNATTYNWNFGDPLSGASDSSKLQNPSHIYALPGNYTVILVASTSGHCADTMKQVVTVSPAPKPVVSGNDSICAGGSTTLTASGATSYTWNPGSLSGAVVTVFPATTTTYTVSGTNGTCSHDTTFTVVVTPLPVGTITAKPDTICVGDSAKLIASGGTSYVWSPGGSTNDSIWVKPGSTATYTLTLTQKKCSSTVTQVVTVQSALTMSLTLSKDSICPTDSAVLTVIGANTYTWSTGATTSSITVKPGVTTPYWVKATNRCATDSLSKTLHIMPLPKPSVTGNDSICVGSSSTLTASGGTQYTWMPGSLKGSSVTVSPTVSTTYTVTASNGHCTHDTTFTVAVSPYPTPSITFSVDSVCPKDSAQLIASGGGTYSWSPGGQTNSTIWVKPASTTTYTVTVTKNGCSATAMQQVALYPIGSSSLTLTRNNICPNDSTTLAVTGGLSYKWSPGGATTASIHITPSSTITYSVIVQVRCTADTLKQTVTVVPFPVITLAGNTNICPGTNTVLTASGGTSYSWNGGSTTTSGSITVNPYVKTTYTVEVFNGACGKDTTITVTMQPAPVVTITEPKVICEGENLTITATGGGTYSWSNGATTSSITMPAAFADSMLVVTVTNGCSTIDTARVKITPVTPITACCDSTIPLGTSVSLGATGAVGYVWIPESTLNCFTCPITVATPTATTTYTVVGTDANGCKSDAFVTLTIECEDFIVPNVFTPPNGDIKHPENNVFYIKASGEEAYTVTIYDRWGKQVFTSSNPTDYWNGGINNTSTLVPDGVYYYIISSSCGTNTYDKKGFVQVIRSN